jgi:hypothetical protein
LNPKIIAMSDTCQSIVTGCSTTVAPIYYTFLIPTAAIDSRYSAITTLDSDSFKEYVVAFGFNGTNQTVNNNICNVSSLEVYRGREQGIEISYQGFSLSDNGSIEVRCKI